MKNAITFASLFMLTIFSSFASASPLTSEMVKSFEGEYVGTGFKYGQNSGKTCSVEVKIKFNKVSFKVSGETIRHAIKGKILNDMTSYSTDKYKISKLVSEATGNYQVFYNKFYNFDSLRYYNVFTIEEGALTGVTLSFQSAGVLDFYQPLREEIQAECVNLKKVR